MYCGLLLSLSFPPSFAHSFISVTSSAREFLELCSGRKEDPVPCLASGGGMVSHTDNKFEHVNVLVTSGSLIPSLVKCLLFRLDNLITHGNGQSSPFISSIFTEVQFSELYFGDLSVFACIALLSNCTAFECSELVSFFHKNCTSYLR